ncbi:MAG: hypothetical protein KKF77_11600 [Proteobacteria bacterium]|nr:hypothetical protein [Pseudomonadota bacterium]
MHSQKPLPLTVLPLLALALLLMAALAGCASMPQMLGGSGDLTLTLDGEQNHEATLARGQVLSLDMRDPAASGYVLAGASFDPTLLRLDGIVYQPGGRVRYQFSATDKGESDIQIKIKRKEPGSRPDVFKRVHVIAE